MAKINVSGGHDHRGVGLELNKPCALKCHCAESYVTMPVLFVEAMAVAHTTANAWVDLVHKQTVTHVFPLLRSCQTEVKITRSQLGSRAVRLTGPQYRNTEKTRIPKSMQ